MAEDFLNFFLTAGERVNKGLNIADEYLDKGHSVGFNFLSSPSFLVIYENILTYTYFAAARRPAIGCVLAVRANGDVIHRGVSASTSRSI